MAQVYKVPLVLTPQPEGGFTVTCPVLPELVTEGDSPEEVMENVRDALEATLETYKDLDKPLPANLRQDPRADAIWFEYLVTGR
ncbi:MAG: type II toxin-antitoxin system HicB family antitoxin [Planctomycetota bacterium]|nr:MAG: type II toxin-antitoxin system HicB family antitoxin [Planctomycetota bacterium]